MTIDDVVMKLNKKSLFCLKPSVRFFFCTEKPTPAKKWNSCIQNK